MGRKAKCGISSFLRLPQYHKDLRHKLTRHNYIDECKISISFMDLYKDMKKS